MSGWEADLALMRYDLDREMRTDVKRTTRPLKTEDGPGNKPQGSGIGKLARMSTARFRELREEARRHAVESSSSGTKSRDKDSVVVDSRGRQATVLDSRKGRRTTERPYRASTSTNARQRLMDDPLMDELRQRVKRLEKEADGGAGAADTRRRESDTGKARAGRRGEARPGRRAESIFADLDRLQRQISNESKDSGTSSRRRKRDVDLDRLQRQASNESKDSGASSRRRKRDVELERIQRQISNESKDSGASARRRRRDADLDRLQRQTSNESKDSGASSRRRKRDPSPENPFASRKITSSRHDNERDERFAKNGRDERFAKKASKYNEYGFGEPLDPTAVDQSMGRLDKLLKQMKGDPPPRKKRELSPRRRRNSRRPAKPAGATSLSPGDWMPRLTAASDIAPFLRRGFEHAPSIDWNNPSSPRLFGQACWALLHKVGDVYPRRPSKSAQKAMARWLVQFLLDYPCPHCKRNIRKNLEVSGSRIGNPPLVESAEALQWWLCDLHNRVNEELGKRVHPCPPKPSNAKSKSKKSSSRESSKPSARADFKYRSRSVGVRRSVADRDREEDDFLSRRAKARGRPGGAGPAGRSGVDAGLSDLRERLNRLDQGLAANRGRFGGMQDHSARRKDRTDPAERKKPKDESADWITKSNWRSDPFWKDTSLGGGYFSDSPKRRLQSRRSNKYASLDDTDLVTSPQYKALRSPPSPPPARRRSSAGGGGGGCPFCNKNRNRHRSYY